MFKLGYLLFLSLLVFGHAAKTINSHLSDADQQRLNKVFLDGIKSNDLQSIYYSALNLKNLAKEIQTDACNRLVNLHGESKLNEFEKNFYLTGAHHHLRCANAVPSEILSAIRSALSKETKTAHELYYNYFSNKHIGNTIDDATKTRIATNLQTILKTDDSLSNLGHAFNIAADHGTRASTLSKWIEGTIAQADEVDGKLLQFEGGLSITALILNGVLKFSRSLQTAAPLNEDQLSKFVAYFMSRRLVQQPKGASVLLEVLETIAADKKTAPICIDFVGNGLLQPESPAVHVKIVDILGKPVAGVSSAFATVASKADGSVLASKHPLVAKSSDKTLFELDLKSLKPSRGSYTIDISADVYKQTLHAKVLGKVKVALLEIGIGESDSASAVQKQTVTYPNKLSAVLNADHQQKILLKTLLVDESTNEPVSVHQAFILFEDKKTQREIIFVAEQDTSKAYKFDLDVGARSVYFQHKSGVYALELIVGDASLSNSFRWHLADLELKFLEKEQPVAAAERNVSRAPKPEIIHQFREADKRPSRIVSDVFTALCAAPLLILFVLWSRIGINVSNFPASLSALGFHLGFGSILALFGVFWYQLNMFETLRLLIPLGILTFFFGNRLLRLIASRKSTESK